MSAERPNFDKPEFTVRVGNSRAEVFDMKGILADARKGKVVLYDNKEFGGPISLVQIDSKLVESPSGVSGFSYTGKIRFENNVPEVDDILNECKSSYVKKAAQGSEIKRTRYGNFFNLSNNDEPRFALHIDRGNKLIVVSNEFPWKEGHDELIVHPQAEQNTDQVKAFESFMKHFMQVGEVVAESTNDVFGYERIIDQSYTIGKERKVTTVRPRRPAPRPSKAPVVFEAPKKDSARIVPDERSISLDDIGGLQKVKAQLRDIALSFNHPEIMAKWDTARPQGVLLYGEPGTGKTMLAKALASEIGAEVLELNGSDIYEKYLGDSEKKVKEIFNKARKAQKPMVILMDEFDSMMSTTSNPSSGGGDAARNSVAGIFKQELNTLSKANPNVLLVATTNSYDKIDPALIRSGRFDHKVYVPMPDEQGRQEIISGIVAKSIIASGESNFSAFSDDLDVPALSRVTDGMNGADISEIMRRLRFDKAMQEARGRNVQPITHQDIARGIDEFKITG